MMRVPEQADRWHFRAFQYFQQRRGIGEVAVRFKEHGHAAPPGILAQVAQTASDPLDRGLPGLLWNNLVAENADMWTLQLVCEVDESFPFVQLGGPLCRLKLVQA